jgi:L-aminopeptidase/D-esterase-like protein
MKEEADAKLQASQAEPVEKEKKKDGSIIIIIATDVGID